MARKPFNTFLPFLGAGLMLILYALFTLHVPSPAARVCTEALRFEIHRGENPASLAARLDSLGWIRDRRVFRLYLLFSGKDRSIHYGMYSLPRGADMVDIATTISGKNPAPHTITIPEGNASWQIFSILHRQLPYLDSSLFDSLVHDPQFAATCGLPFPSLQGFLFPDTYEFPYGITEREIIQALTRRFLEVWVTEASTPSTVLAQYGQLGTITLASIVEEEAATPSEMPLIAGVFLNRLKIGYTLGADPTIRFALRKLEGPLTEEDLEVSGPYNTRTRQGLPPGPISNPGLRALRAALFPQTTVFLYFVAREDGSREHYFSSSNDEHNRFKALARRNRERG